MNQEQFIKKLKNHILHTYGTQQEAAKAWGVHKTFVTHIVTGQSNPTRTILDDMGLEMVVKKSISFRRKKDEPATGKRNAEALGRFP